MSLAVLSTAAYSGQAWPSSARTALTVAVLGQVTTTAWVADTFGRRVALVRSLRSEEADHDPEAPLV